jgi:hypothetical protein
MSLNGTKTKPRNDKQEDKLRKKSMAQVMSEGVKDKMRHSNPYQYESTGGSTMQMR